MAAGDTRTDCRPVLDRFRRLASTPARLDRGDGHAILADTKALLRMKTCVRLLAPSVLGPALRLAACLLFLGLALAQAEHRATRLGHPSTRFAPPLSTPEQLRTLLTNETMQADVLAILQQARWSGNVRDLQRAAATAEIKEVKLPKGTRLPFMSSRKDGKPVTLMDVLWVGEEPIDAYEFFFSSNGRRYRCVTPKPCSNFLVIDLGPDQPALSLVKTAPAEASRCAAFPVQLVVRNTSTLPVTQVRVVDPLPAGWKTGDGQTTLSLDLGDLAPGAGKEINFQVVALLPGTEVNRAEVTSAEGARAEASATTAVRGPALTLSCEAPAEVIMGRPAELCLTVKNTGDAPETGATITLPLPPGAKVVSTTAGGVTADGRLVWDLPTLAPEASQQVCASLSLAEPGTLPVVATARGACATPVETRSATRVVGVPGVLVEVVDQEDPIEIGKTVTYDIRVTNQGSVPLTASRLVCTVPEEQEFVSGTGTTAVQAQGRTLLMDPLPTLAPKAQATWRVVTKALKPGDARFKVAYTSEQFARPIDEDESTTHY